MDELINQLPTSAENKVKLSSFQPREYQQELFDQLFIHKKRQIYLCWARGAGKDVACWNAIIRYALIKPGVYFYALPTAVQCRQVIFDTLLSDGRSFIDFIPKTLIQNINNSRMLIRLVNGSIIQCVGSEETSSRLVGTNPTGVVWSEWQVSREESYTYLRPRLALNDGFAIFNGTPRGMSNHFYTMYQIAKSNPEDWFCSYKTVYDTKHISPARLAKEKAEMSIDKFNQEFLCDFNCGQAGTYFGNQMDKARLENRISDNVVYESSFPVWVAIDIGVSDPTAVIWYQIIGNVVRVLECTEFTDQGVDYLKKILDAKDYVYAKPVWAGHDLKVREWGSAGALSRIQSAENLGLTMQPVDRVPLTEGIEAVRMMLGRTWFNQTKSARLIASLENYRRIYNEETKAYQEKPLHDWTSHLTSAFMYATLAMPQCYQYTSPEELTRMYNEARRGVKQGPPIFQDNPHNRFR